MPEYLAPGVFIEEIERGPRPIEGVPTSTAAFLGETERGPITPRLVSSYIEYKRWFGDVFGNRDRYMPYAASGFFENGGRRLFVCRIVGEQAATALIEFDNFSVSAVGAGEWGNRIFAKIEVGTTLSVRPGEAAPSPVGFRLRVAYWAKFPDGFQVYDPFLDANRAMLPRPNAVEDWDDLTVEPNSPDFYEKRLTGNSALVELKRIDETIADLPAPERRRPARKRGGCTGDPGGRLCRRAGGRPAGRSARALRADARPLPRGRAGSRAVFRSGPGQHFARGCFALRAHAIPLRGARS